MPTTATRRGSGRSQGAGGTPTAGKQPTIVDVARSAGVSKATVSAVINDTAGVRDTTRDRVLSAIELLNYRSHSVVSRGSGTRLGKAIGIIIKEHDNPYYADVIDGVRSCAEARGYTLLVASSEGQCEIERRAVMQLQGMGVDGFIVTPTLGEDADLSHFFELKRRNIPFVLLEYVRGVRASLVDVDGSDGSRAAVEHLIAQGHTRIVHFAGPGYSANSAERLDGVRRAFSASHLGLADTGVIPAGAHLEDGYRAGLACFSNVAADDRPTAVTCYNDLVAVGLYRALKELRLRVPEDVSVVGYDDIPICEYLDVPLTSVRTPKFEMGEIAAQMLVRHVESKQRVASQKVSLAASLVVRASVAPPSSSGVAVAVAPTRTGVA